MDKIVKTEIGFSGSSLIILSNMFRQLFSVQDYFTILVTNFPSNPLTGTGREELRIT